MQYNDDYITTYTLASFYLETNILTLLNEHIYKILYTASAGGQQM